MRVLFFSIIVIAVAGGAVKLLLIEHLKSQLRALHPDIWNAREPGTALGDWGVFEMRVLEECCRRLELHPERSGEVVRLAKLLYLYNWAYTSIVTAAVVALAILAWKTR